MRVANQPAFERPVVQSEKALSNGSSSSMWPFTAQARRLLRPCLRQTATGATCSHLPGPSHLARVPEQLQP